MDGKPTEANVNSLADTGANEAILQTEDIIGTSDNIPETIHRKIQPNQKLLNGVKNVHATKAVGRKMLRDKRTQDNLIRVQQ